MTLNDVIIGQKCSKLANDRQGNFKTNGTNFRYKLDTSFLNERITRTNP